MHFYCDNPSALGEVSAATGTLVCNQVSSREDIYLGEVNSHAPKCHLGTLESEGQSTSGALLVSASAGKHRISNFVVPQRVRRGHAYLITVLDDSAGD